VRGNNSLIRFSLFRVSGEYLYFLSPHIFKSRYEGNPTIQKMIRTRNQASTAQEPTKSNQVTTTKQHALNMMKNVMKESDHSARSTLTEATQIEKSVAFAPHATVRHTIARQDLSSEELKATWFSEEEYLQISKQCSKQIHKMDRGETFKDKKYCARGLESSTRMGTITKSKSRAESIRAVLQEQYVQIREGVLDEDAIGIVYQDVTSSCQIWASVVGYRDQHAAEICMDEEEIQVLPQTGVVTRREPHNRIKCSPKSIVVRPNRIIISARSA
jgi:hypothetical protein